MGARAVSETVLVAEHLDSATAIDDAVQRVRVAYSIEDIPQLKIESPDGSYASTIDSIAACDSLYDYLITRAASLACTEENRQGTSSESRLDRRPIQDCGEYQDIIALCLAVRHQRNRLARSADHLRIHGIPFTWQLPTIFS